MEKLHRVPAPVSSPCPATCHCPRRHGAILIWFTIMLSMLLGMVGLVIDAGLLMATHRQAQNAADAAAMAAADDLMRGRSNGQATTTATTYVQQHNGSSDWTPEVHIPPSSGPYAGLPQYAEVIVTAPMQTFFIHILGVSQDQQVRARAVAGSETLAAGEGLIVLDPDARPGISVQGGAALKVFGKVIDNSEGGGVDENGVPIADASQYAATTGNSPQPGTGVYAADIRVVGGVDIPENFKNIDPAGSPDVLHCRELSYGDPLINLPIPTVATGVDPTFRGDPYADATGMALNDPSGTDINRIITQADGQQVMVLHPGIYGSITIAGGNVVLTPGIYVVSPKHNVINSLLMTGGTITAEGVMFYNTGNSYSPDNGTPDINDGQSPPPQRASDLGDTTAYWGGLQINASMKFSPLGATLSYDPADYVTPGYSPPIVSKEFDGMFFFQRRRNNSTLVITGNSAESTLAGTLYAKWALNQITGQGAYDAQFVVGSMAVSGNGDVTVNYAGQKLGKAPVVFLVE